MKKRKTAKLPKIEENVFEIAPGTRVCVNQSRNGKDLWIRGYEVFDPEKIHSITGRKGGGQAPLTIKKRVGLGQILIIGAGQKGKPVPRNLSDVKPEHEVGESFTFAQIFGQYVGGALELASVSIEEDRDDTSLGLESPASESEGEEED